MRCPSHPLARRVLDEVYGARGGRNSILPNAVVGFNALIPTHSSYSAKVEESSGDDTPGTQTNEHKSHPPLPPTTAKGVCSQLLNSEQMHMSQTSPETHATTVYVLNGEDKREMFSVPTCQFKYEAPVSLVINDRRRTIRIVRQSQHKGVTVDVRSSDVLAALLRQPKGPGKNSTNVEVVTAVLRKWTVV